MNAEELKDETPDVSKREEYEKPKVSHETEASKETIEAEFEKEQEFIKPEDLEKLEEPEEEEAEEEEPEKVEKPQPRKYYIQKGLIGKFINALFKMVGNRYPTIAQQLELTDWEIELLDEAVKPLLERLLKRYKFGSEWLNIAMVFVIIFMPRLILISQAVAEEQKAKKVGVT